MRIEILHGNRLPADWVARWREILGNSQQSPYYSPGFVSMCSQVYPDTYVASIRDRDSTKSDIFFPFRLKENSIAVPTAEWLSDFDGLIGQKIDQISLEELATKCSFKEWRFRNVPTSQKNFLPFNQQVAQAPWIDLQEGADAYKDALAAGGSKVLRRLRYLRKRLVREVGPLRLIEHTDAESSLDLVLGWKSAQYARNNRPDTFAVPWVRNLIDTILSSKDPSCRGVLSLLMAGSRPIAGHFGMRSSNVLHYWYPAYDIRYSQYSPGLLLLLALIEHVPSVGISKIDFGRGTEPYKCRFMNKVENLAEGIITPLS